MLESKRWNVILSLEAGLQLSLVRACKLLANGIEGGWKVLIFSGLEGSKISLHHAVSSKSVFFTNRAAFFLRWPGTLKRLGQ
jgi:hypothetical protein